MEKKRKSYTRFLYQKKKKKKKKEKVTQGFIPSTRDQTEFHCKKRKSFTVKRKSYTVFHSVSTVFHSKKRKSFTVKKRKSYTGFHPEYSGSNSVSL